MTSAVSAHAPHAETDHQPQVLIPYSGPAYGKGLQDIFVYMRPETNGVLGESAMVRVVNKCPEYHKNLNLIYLANIPGEYIRANHIVEKHYATKLYFAAQGKQAFTDAMQRTFSEYFKRRFETAQIVGAFEAVESLGFDMQALFSEWVADDDFLTVSGQTIKHTRGYYVVNYDIPLLLHKNNRNTNIAVMLFRTDTPYEYIRHLVELMYAALISSGVIPRNCHISRAFHYSKGPFEQLLDGVNHLFTADKQTAQFEDISFGRYLLDNGVTSERTREIINNPMGIFRDTDGKTTEDTIFNYTQFDDYHTAFEKLHALERLHHFLH